MGKNKAKIAAEEEQAKKFPGKKGRQGKPDMVKFFDRNINKLPFVAYMRADRNLRGLSGKNFGGTKA